MSAPADPRSPTTTAAGAVPAPRPQIGHPGVQTPEAELFLLEDLGESGRTSALPESDLAALRSVADWIKAFVIRPNDELGRPGPVCPFVPVSLERKTLWLAPQQIADRSEQQVVDVMDRYRRLLLAASPADGGDATYQVIVVVFPDLPAERAAGVFGGVLQSLAVPAYTQDEILFGPYYPGNQTPAIHNAGFHPFSSPVPFMFVRHGVVGDWEFFLDDPDATNRWGHRYQESATQALAEVLRGLPWRERSRH